MLASAFLVATDITTPSHQESGAGWSAGIGGSCGNAFDALDGGHRGSTQGFPPDAQAAFEQERALCREKGGDRLKQSWWVLFGGSDLALLIVVSVKRREADSPSLAFKAGHLAGGRRARRPQEDPSTADGTDR